MTLDILQETLLKGDTGLMILVDFEKAISKVLRIFKFSKKKTFKLLKVYKKNSKSKILQNGHLSEIIQLRRGCRQGNPISPYLFVLAVEPLGETFRKHIKLRGISVHGREHRISQFADDTTLFMKYNESNLRECMSILNNFFQISGLKINVEKTKAIRFGVTGDSRMILCEDSNLIWTHEFTLLGIDYNVQNLNNITELNLESKILEMEKLSFIWNSRHLTLIGKITIIKTLMISKNNSHPTVPTKTNRGNSY